MLSIQLPLCSLGSHTSNESTTQAWPCMEITKVTIISGDW